MHVLMLCALEVWALPGRGGAPTLYRTLRAYGERGHRVTYIAPAVGANAFSPSPPPDIDGVTFERFHLPSLQESRLPLPQLLKKADQKLRFAVLYPFLAAHRARSVLERDPVDLLYAYEVHGALAARLLRSDLPTVARFQGTVMYQALASPLERLRRYEELLALRLPADIYIMTNDGTRGDEVLRRVNSAAGQKLRFWRNGLDLDRLGPAEASERPAKRAALGLAADDFVLLTASRLAAWKRVDRAIAALPRILRGAPNALLLVVGDGEERANLERQARALDVAERVRFAGAVPQERVLDYMHAADLFLAPADLSNVGNPLLEAMTCGLPIITVDAGATGELIRDGDTGRLLATGAPEAIADAVVALAEDNEERGRLGAGARHYAESEFWTWEARLAAELDEVERLVSQTAQPVAGSR
ncbi:MAG: glycosyltransferase family 4 protein [Chloroflexi bacterium]|nr:glycosyltransferase family 4 protein [Chloroflexota bacterium]